MRHGVVAERVAARADLAEQPRILGRGVAGDEERRVLVGAREQAQHAQRVRRRPVVERERDQARATSGVGDCEAGRDLREDAVVDPRGGGRRPGTGVVRLHGRLRGSAAPAIGARRSACAACPGTRHERRARRASRPPRRRPRARRRPAADGASCAAPASDGARVARPATYAGMVGVPTARRTRVPSARTFRPRSAHGDHRRRGRRIG